MKGKEGIPGESRGVRIKHLGPLVPASLSLRAGKPFRSQKYRDYVESLAWLIKAEWVGRAPDSKGGWGVRVKIWAAKGDLDNHIVPLLNSATGLLWLDDKQVRHIEATLSRNGPATLEAEFWPLKGEPCISGF